jgi:hypothetical protein
MEVELLSICVSRKCSSVFIVDSNFRRVKQDFLSAFNTILLQ